MDRINALRQSRTEADAAHEALLAAHLLAADGKRGFTVEEKTAQKELETKVSGLDELLAAEEKRLAIEKRRAQTGPRRIEVGAPNIAEDPRKGFRSHRDWALAVMKAGKRGGATTDERLKLLMQNDPEDEEAGGEPAFLMPEAFTPASLRGFKAAAGSDEQGVYDDKFGGITVGRTLLPGVLQLGFEGDPSSGRTQPVPMATPTVDMIARTDKDHTTSVSGGFTVTRKPETVAAASARASMEMVTLKATGLFGLAFATEEILSDSPISFVAVIEAGFRDQFAHQILSEKLRGKGGNEYLGILTALASLNAGPTISIAKVGGQGAGTIVVDNTINMRSRCWGYSNAIWIANHDTYPQLSKLNIPIGVAGQLVYQQSMVEDRPDTLHGRPIFYSEYPSTVGQQGDVILANWSQFLEGLYQPLQSAESIHARFLNHERTFKLWQRNAGAPWWRSPLTPHKGANTLSPFVVLDVRA